VEEHGDIDVGFAESDKIIEFEQNGRGCVAGVEAYIGMAEWMETIGP
jgi:hypothetical protein